MKSLDIMYSTISMTQMTEKRFILNIARLKEKIKKENMKRMSHAKLQDVIRIYVACYVGSVSNGSSTLVTRSDVGLNYSD